jgi:outer membrane protein assembly factor BamB
VNAIDGASGKLLWQERVTGPFSASPVVADDKIYVVNEKGRIFVLQTGEQSKILGTGDLDDVILATPAIADGAVFFRSDRWVYCFQSPKK